MQFSELGLTAPLLSAVKNQGFEQPTPIQQQAIPPILAGRDVLGTAKTGTGKTAAFALPIVQRLARRRPAGRMRPIRALVLSPTRELAAQNAESFGYYGRAEGLRQTVVFGGVGQQPQVQALDQGVDVLVATPGRLMDLMQQGYVSLEAVETFVLDEADRMLDMGFIADIRRVAEHLPAERQTLLFSATMPADIRRLADSLMKDPVEVMVDPPASPVEQIAQHVCFVEKPHKVDLLVYALGSPELTRVLAFTRTKHGADRVAKMLVRSGVNAAAIHGNKSQSERTRALEGFKSGRLRVLVATDIASRGLDVEGVSLVVNYDMPNEPEAYIHRIGRTGRAGASGLALSLCAVDERTELREIERLMGRHISRIEEHPFRSTVREPPPSVLDPRQLAANRETARRLGGRSVSRMRRATPRSFPRA
jgi:ATP-dependent RNA helicase RhlE